MADAVLIQNRINHGLGIAASHLGQRYAHYRPQSSGQVLTQINMIETLMMAVDHDPAFSFKAPLNYKNDVYYALCDYTEFQIGDYLWDYAANIYFVANFEPLKPVMLIRCLTTVTVQRPATNNRYSGNTGPQTLLAGWPCSILQGTKGETNESHLPGAVRAPWVLIKLPMFAGVTIQYADIIIDQLNRRYVVSQNELTPMGWNITASLESP